MWQSIRAVPGRIHARGGGQEGGLEGRTSWKEGEQGEQGRGGELGK